MSLTERLQRLIESHGSRIKDYPHTHPAQEGLLYFYTNSAWFYNMGEGLQAWEFYRR